jgi:hypothetical protein
MPGLREEVISIICNEWPNGETALNPATLCEQLQNAGVSVSEAEVRLELEHLTDHRDIEISLEPGGTAGPTVTGVRPGFCP